MEKIKQDFIETGGKISATLGMGRIVGQIYALLFINDEPFCLDDITERLGISKGSASTNIRTLQGWGAAKEVWVRGDRKNFYEAERDFIAILNNGILANLGRKMTHVAGFIERMDKALREADKSKGEKKNKINIYKTRLKEVSRIYYLLNNLLSNGISMTDTRDG